ELAANRNPFRVRAFEELAKHYEHREKNYAMALDMTLQALALEDTPEIRRRETRLKARISRPRAGRLLWSCGRRSMADIITDYQKWKQQGENLRVQARQAMEGRFRELLVEAVQIAEEYRADFGAALKPPPQVTAFRYKASAKAKPKKPAPPKAGAKSAPAAA